MKNPLSIVKKTSLSAKKLKYYLTTFKPERFIQENVPYFAQWESPNLIDKIIKRKIKASDDPKWKLSGAETKEEYVLWSWNACALACAKMVIKKLTGQEPKLVKMGKSTLKYKAYKPKKSMDLLLNEIKDGKTDVTKEDVLKGVYYRQFVKYLKKDWKLKAKVVNTLIRDDIIWNLSKGRYVIASVSPMIRNPHSTPHKKGGHLVLMVGYDLKRHLLYLHNPSGTEKTNQAYAQINFKDFDKFFAKRGIVIKTK